MTDKEGYVRVEDYGEWLQSSKKFNYAPAIVALVCLIASWEAMGELIQDTLTTTYDHPYFVNWTLHCGYMVWLWVIPFHYCWYGCVPLKITRYILMKAFGLNCMLLTADYLWYLSLKHTLVAANNAIYQSNCAFVYFFSIIFLNEEFDIYRVLAMLIMIGGMILVLFETDISSSTGADSSSGGYAIVVLSVLVFALYEVMFDFFYPGKKHDKEGSKGYSKEYKPSLADLAEGKTEINRNVGKNWETMSFVAYMGIINILFMWIPLVIFDAAGVEEFELPKTANVAHRLILNAALGASYTSSYLVGIAFTSPTFMSVGALLVVPVGVVTDYLLHDVLIPPLSGVGCGIIAVGFICSILRLRSLGSHKNEGSSSDLSGHGEVKREITTKVLEE